MKAAVYSRYGPPDVLEVKDVDKPIPGDSEARHERDDSHLGNSQEMLGCLNQTSPGLR
jgi:hypothetical protein